MIYSTYGCTSLPLDDAPVPLLNKYFRLPSQSISESLRCSPLLHFHSTQIQHNHVLSHSVVNYPPSQLDVDETWTVERFVK